jgi:hypothetical protein
LGLAVLAWVAWGFVGTHSPALAMTGVIAATYLLGAWELRQFRAASAALAAALADGREPARLDDWLEGVPAGLRAAVRARVEGQGRGLPGPALTPYLVGLLVMLGMLGTFLGMVLTFQGAVFALEGSADLQAMRSALAAPIKGLGLAFGTSVAGVAASAMLGLMSALCRRERLELARELDGRIATVLRPFSPAFQREASLQALQVQAGALPQVAAQLESLMQRLDERSQQLDAQLLARQERLHGQTLQTFEALADSVGRSLRQSMAEGTQAASQSITPVVSAALSQVVQESQRLHDRLGEVAQAQVDGLMQQFGDAAQRQSEHWRESLQVLAADLQAQWQHAADQAVARHQALCQSLDDATHAVAERTQAQAGRTLDEASGLLNRTEALVQARIDAEVRWQAEHGQRMDQLAALWRQELQALRTEESQRGEAAVARLAQLEAAVAGHLAQLGLALEAPLSRLLHTAAEVPQAAAGVVAQLREDMGRMAERDQQALAERALLLEQLAALLQTVNHAAGEQRVAIESLVASAGTVLAQAAERASQVLQAQAERAGQASADLGAGAVELASLGEAFGQGVQLFQASNDKLVESLQRIEASIERSARRSDEQLAYYVAQAREVIDLSIASQQGLVERWRDGTR